MDWLTRVQEGGAKARAPQMRAGDEVRVWVKILEQGKERLSPFEGTVLRVRGFGATKTCTVRRITFGEGVERVFPLEAPCVARIEVLRRGKVHRSRLYYLRRLVGRSRIALESEPDATQPDTRRAGPEAEVAPAEPSQTAARTEESHTTS